MSRVLFLCWGEGMLGFDFLQDFILELPGWRWGIVAFDHAHGICLGWRD